MNPEKLKKSYKHKTMINSASGAFFFTTFGNQYLIYISFVYGRGDKKTLFMNQLCHKKRNAEDDSAAEGFCVHVCPPGFWRRRENS